MRGGSQGCPEMAIELVGQRPRGRGLGPAEPISAPVILGPAVLAQPILAPVNFGPAILAQAILSPAILASANLVQAILVPVNLWLQPPLLQHFLLQ